MNSMNKTLFALAALTAAAGAAAQSSNVSLFGVVDASVARITTTGKSVSAWPAVAIRAAAWDFAGWRTSVAA